jgi:hypothetical protein
MVHTSREELERLAELRAERFRPSREDREGSRAPRIVGDGRDTAAAPPGPPEQPRALRDRSRLPRVYLDARRRLRERLSTSETSTDAHSTRI